MLLINTIVIVCLTVPLAHQYGALPKEHTYSVRAVTVDGVDAPIAFPRSSEVFVWGEQEDECVWLPSPLTEAELSILCAVGAMLLLVVYRSRSTVFDEFETGPSVLVALAILGLFGAFQYERFAARSGDPDVAYSHASIFYCVTLPIATSLAVYVLVFGKMSLRWLTSLSVLQKRGTLKAFKRDLGVDVSPPKPACTSRWRGARTRNDAVATAQRSRNSIADSERTVDSLERQASAMSGGGSADGSHATQRSPEHQIAIVRGSQGDDDTTTDGVLSDSEGDTHAEVKIESVSL